MNYEHYGKYYTIFFNLYFNMKRRQRVREVGEKETETD